MEAQPLADRPHGRAQPLSAHSMKVSAAGRNFNRQERVVANVDSLELLPLAMPAFLAVPSDFHTQTGSMAPVRLPSRLIYFPLGVYLVSTSITGLAAGGVVTLPARMSGASIFLP